MPSITSISEEANDTEHKMRSALKRYIIRERQRKKEEYEAEVEEERLRKEMEARERQDVMTLEETKEQIEQLEQKMKQLEKEKQKLFMQLKKVLNEVDTRKRQQQKESNDMQSMKMSMQGGMQMPMFSIPTSASGEPPLPQNRPPPLSSHILNKNKHSGYMLLQQPPIVRTPVQSANKRQRSPSPTYSLYTHRLHQPPMKHQAVYSDHKLEDGRMGRQISRAVLWNKPPSQYTNQVSSSNLSNYYAMPSSAGVVVGDRPPPLLYAHQSHHAGIMYAPAQPQPLYMEMLKNNPPPSHNQEQKKDTQNPAPQVLIGLSEPHHPAVSVSYQTARHLIHPPQHNNIQVVSQAAKPGSITQGYPVQPANPTVQNPNIYPNRHRY